MSGVGAEPSNCDEVEPLRMTIDPSVEERMSETEGSKPKKTKQESGRSKKHAHVTGEEITRPSEVKKERRSRKGKVTFSEGKNGLDEEEGTGPMKEKKERGSRAENSDREIVSPEEASKSRRSSKERESKGDKAADVEDASVFAEEGSKAGKSEKQRRPRKGKETVPHHEGGSKKRGKKSRKKSHDVQPVKTCGKQGLSAMVEPWDLLKAVVKSHREAVLTLKGIMDLQAAKTGDRTMLHQLEKLLTQD